MSGLGDGMCWYRDASCPARSQPDPCDAVPSVGFDSGLRLCPCFDPAQPMLPCMGNEPTISAAGGIYFVDGSSSPIAYGDGHRTLSITAGAAHPLRFIHEGGLSQCRPTMAPLPASPTAGPGVTTMLSGPNDGGVTYEYYYG